MSRIPVPEEKSPKSSVTEEHMYQDVYDAIMEHRLPPGTKLTEQVLCQIYSTARHTVRKVLTRLSTEGLVDLEANRGAFIASPSSQEAKDMFEMRNILEHAALAKVASHAGTRQLAALRKLVNEERAAHQRGDRPTWIRLSARFHLELAMLTDNALLVDALHRLVSRTTLLIANIDAPGQNACSFDEHDDVLSALEKGDLAQAQHHMAHHLQHCEERVQPEASEGFDLRNVLGKSIS
ncbi:GntR family transcriptional regulator [Herbaspirillum sp. RTI4]|uniref:GntR family transcriptional regulator n=1 Tax=Herbaspirillum sp. RTI4 TaxID=3048640 RepID=UPI002AB3C394|nr:GntR family transcriptional regulator [Herbaspirillum sp. RTI4]MDY7576896.1 GntR family transcriptional regulator [Herbaspirillum sp. RTI4]MEA9982498.1 GntR family transcriptional regulator [Herbaspirillum sp. RTI4]